MVPFITASLPGPEAAKQPQTMTLPPPDFTVGMMFFFWNPVFLLRQMYWDTHLPKSSTFVTSIRSKSWGSSRCFRAKMGRVLMFFLLSSGFRLGTLPCRPFLPSLFLMNTDLNWGKWGLKFFVIVGSFVTSWMSRRCALGVILFGWPLLGRFTTVPCFRRLWKMALTVVRWSPKALEMALQPLPDW